MNVSQNVVRNEERVAPVVKFVGGKRQLLPELRKHLPTSFGRYFEPCVGGGALFFDLAADERHHLPAVLGDTNARLIAMYRGVRDDVEGVIHTLNQLTHTPEVFAEVRARDVDAQIADYDNIGAAVWFLYLNKTCYNGLYRVNRAGHFNVPRGQYVNPRICDAPALRRASRALQGVRLMVDDFVVSTEDALPGDLTYIDPPYIPVSETSDFTSYTSAKFKPATSEAACGPSAKRESEALVSETIADAKTRLARDPKYQPTEHVRLRDHALALHARGVHVILSNSGAPFVRELYGAPPFVIHDVQATRAVNSKAGKRGKVPEVIITAPLTR